MIRYSLRARPVAALLALAACAASAPAQSGKPAASAPLPPNTVIAIVLGKPITYGQIQINSFANQTTIGVPKSSGPAFANSAFFMNPDMQERFAGMRLGGMIAQQVRDNLVAREHLQPTPAMIEATKLELANEMFGGQPMDKALAQRRAKILTIKKALDQVMAGKNPDQVYKTEAASLISPPFWQMEVKAYRTPQGKKGLQMALDSMSADRYRDTIATMAPEKARNEAISKFVDAKISATDPRYKTYAAEANPDPNATAYLRQKRSAWWSAETNRDVVFKVERFRDAALQYSSGIGGPGNRGFEQGYMMGAAMGTHRNRVAAASSTGPLVGRMGTP